MAAGGVGAGRPPHGASGTIMGRVDLQCLGSRSKWRMCVCVGVNGVLLEKGEKVFSFEPPYAPSVGQVYIMTLCLVAGNNSLFGMLKQAWIIFQRP